MAKNINNLLTQNYGGKLGKEFVFKTLNGKTFISKYPDRSNVIYSALQKENSSLWKEAVTYARSVCADPVLKAEMEKKLQNNKKDRGRTVYNVCIGQFMLANNRDSRLRKWEELMDRYRTTFDLSEPQFRALEILALGQELSNLVYRDINKVSKPTATRHLQDLVNRGIIELSGKGAGVKYILLPLPGGGE